MAKRTRGKHGANSEKPIEQPPKYLTGLALSGGGIRSTSFCLGVMQALAKQDKLKYFDYLSAVSGSSWIAASVSWFLSQTGRSEPAPNQSQAPGARQPPILRYGLGPQDFPYNTKPKPFSYETDTYKQQKEKEEWLRGRTLTSWLRGRAKVITPGFGFGLGALISTVLRSVIINLLIAIPVILGAFVALRLLLGDFIPSEFWTCQTTGLFCDMTPYLQVYAWSILIFIVLTVLYALASPLLSWFLHKARSKQGRSYWEERIFRLRGRTTKWMGRLLLLLAGLTVLASLPLVNSLLADVTYREWVSAVVSVLGGVMAWLSGVGEKKDAQTEASLALDKIVVPLGCVLLIYGALFALYVVSAKLAQGGTWPDSLTYFLLLAFALGLTPNINHNSLHRFYHDRLMTAFLPDPVYQQDSPAFSERFPLSQLQSVPESRAGKVSGSLWLKLRKAMWGEEGYLASQVIEEEQKYLNGRRTSMQPGHPEIPSGDTSRKGPRPSGAFSFVLNPISAVVKWLLKPQAKPTGNPAAPYLLINTCLTTTDSRDRKLRGRGFSHYLLSSNFVGSDATGYQRTKDFLSDRLTLATAMAISGAAVDPNTYVTRNRALSFLMALLNIRTGFWAPNPNPDLRPVLRRAVPFWFSAIGREMFGMQLNEEKRFIHLSDGGHAENLGIYELIRRRCKFLVAVDAGADPNWNWADFGRVVEQVWVDFGVRIKVKPRKRTRKSDPISAFTEVRPSKPDGVPYKISERAWLVADIEYPPLKSASASAGSKSLNQETEAVPQPADKDGILVLIKTTVTKDLQNAHIHAYKLAHDRFPDETTLDQFFDEEQFEAYRELGFEIGERVMQDPEIAKAMGLSEARQSSKKSRR